MSLSSLPRIAMSPAVSERALPFFTSSTLWSTLIPAGLTRRNPNASGAATESTLPLGSSALNTAPSAKRSSSAVLA
jgi:hypothetical protein